MRTLSRALIPLIAATLAAGIWFGPMASAGVWQDGQIVDTPTYLRYADAFADGKLPYRDVQVEYPPLAFAAILPPRLAGSSYDTFTRAFSALMGACLALAAAATAAAACCLGHARRRQLAAGTFVALGPALAGSAAAAAATTRCLGHSRRRQLAAGAFVALGPALAGSVSLTRFDLWPVALVACGLWALAARRDGTAGLLLGLAVAAKLWPALALPSVLAVAWRRGTFGRTASWTALGAGVPFVFAFGLSPGGLWHALSLQSGRPLQIESLGAASLVVLHHLGAGGPYSVVTSSGSQNLTGGLVGVASALSTAASIVVVLAALALGVRASLRASDDRDAISEVARFTICAVAAGIAFGHVLSPQFVLWLLPFPLLVAGRRSAVLAALCALAFLLTLEEFPGRYWQYAVGLHLGVALLILLRDVVLVAIVIAAAVPTASAGTSRSPLRDLSPRRTR